MVNNEERGGVLSTIRLLLALCIVIAVAIVIFFATDIRAFSNKPMTFRDDLRAFVVENDMSFRDFALKIRRLQISRAPPFYWRALAVEMSLPELLPAGEYELTDKMTPRDFLRQISQEKVKKHRFVVHGGWNFRRLRAALASETGLEQSMASQSDSMALAELGLDNDQADGWFLPGDYYWQAGDTDLDVLRRSHKAMNAMLESMWARKPAGLPFSTREEALLVASIVEAGAAIVDAGLESADRGVPVGAGAAVHEAPSGVPEVVNAAPRDIPANTGVPASSSHLDGLRPVAFPSVASMLAVLQPELGDTLYFVPSDDGTGRLVFSPVLDAQIDVVREWTKAGR